MNISSRYVVSVLLESCETIRAAAVKLRCGRVLTGPFHAAIYDKLRSEHATWDAFMQNAPWVDGFVTSSGRFVDRYEANEIAREASQFKSPIRFNNSAQTDELSAEDAEMK